MVRFDSWRAVWLGNGPGWNLATKSTKGGRATWRAVTRVKLEQASKAAMWVPTRRFSGEGRVDPEETRRGSALKPITIGTDRTTGVVSTARQEGSLRQWGRPGLFRTVRHGSSRALIHNSRSREGLRTWYARFPVNCRGTGTAITFVSRTPQPASIIAVEI